jgi:hypothetical protein
MEDGVIEEAALIPLKHGKSWLETRFTTSLLDTSEKTQHDKYAQKTYHQSSIVLLLPTSHRQRKSSTAVQQRVSRSTL